MKIFWKLSLKRIKFFLLIILVTLSLSSCSKQKTYNGYVEGEFEYISPTTSGILKNLDVQRGQKIQAGQKLFEIDETELIGLIKSAESEILKAEADFKEAKKNFFRAEGLVKKNIISQAEFDHQNSTLKTTEAFLNEAKQNLIILRNKLKEAKPVSKNDSFVQETFFIEGEFIQAGKPVVSLLSSENLKIRFFIPLNLISLVTLGSEVNISADSCGKSNIKAKISYISNKAEFTPPVIFSKSAREKMVFMIEALPFEKNWSCLIPGIPVDIKFIEENGK